MWFCFSFVCGETEQQLSDLVEVKSVSGSEHELSPMTSGTEGVTQGPARMEGLPAADSENQGLHRYRPFVSSQQPCR